jgi:hypothetical protein
MKFGTIIFVGILPTNFHKKKGLDMLFMRLRLTRMVCVILTSVWCGLATLSAAEQQPNVVLFLVDDMGPMDTSVPFMTDADGNAKRYPLNDFYRTPAMARLAAGGNSFQYVLCNECVLTNKNVDSYRAKCRTASGHAMDTIRGK